MVLSARGPYPAWRNTPASRSVAAGGVTRAGDLTVPAESASWETVFTPRHRARRADRRVVEAAWRASDRRPTLPVRAGAFAGFGRHRIYQSRTPSTDRRATTRDQAT